MMRADPFGFLTRCMHECGDVVRLQLLGETVHLISNPAHIRDVLQKHWRNYDKRTRSTAKMSMILGSGLVTSSGDVWKRQRRLSQPAFHMQRIEEFAASMTAVADGIASDWDDHAARGEVVDVYGEMIKVAIRVLQATLFGSSLGDQEIGTISRTVQYLETDVFERFVSPVDVPLYVPTPRNQRFRRTLAELDAVLYGQIAAKRSSPGRDLLTMLIEACDEDGRAFTDHELRDQLVTLLLAGYSTTAATLTWAFYELSRHPQTQRRMCDELQETLGDGAVEFRQLAKLEYSRGVIQEVMRLYPAVWLMKRRAAVRDEIDGYVIPQGSGIFVSPWVTHRNPVVWQNPEGFDPLRFERFKATGHAIPGYLPFGDGPRLCIGNNFALTEIQIVLATLVRRFRLDVIPGGAGVPLPLFAVGPRGGMPMRISRRAPGTTAERAASRQRPGSEAAPSSHGFQERT